MISLWKPPQRDWSAYEFGRVARRLKAIKRGYVNTTATDGNHWRMSVIPRADDGQHRLTPASGAR